MHLGLRMESNSIFAGRISSLLFLCQVLTALDVPPDCKYLQFIAYRIVLSELSLL